MIRYGNSIVRRVTRAVSAASVLASLRSARGQGGLALGASTLPAAARRRQRPVRGTGRWEPDDYRPAGDDLARLGQTGTGHMAVSFANSLCVS